MTNETETLTSGIDPASFSSVIKPTNDLFRYVNGPWIDTYHTRQVIQFRPSSKLGNMSISLTAQRCDDRGTLLPRRD